MSTNDIPIRQNAQSMIELQAAAQTLYGRAGSLFYVQFGFGVVVPVLCATANLLLPQFTVPKATRVAIAGWFALYSLLMMLLDELLIDTRQQTLKTNAATLQEKFDAALFQLPWNATRVHTRLDPSDVSKAARKFLNSKSAHRATNWYAPIVGEAPIELGRLICQRTNLWWDSKLRGRYRYGLIAFAIALPVLGLLVAKALVLNIDGFLIGMMTVAPALRWAVREAKRHGAAQATLDRLSARVLELQRAALERRLDSAAITDASRELQDAIYDHRSSAPIGIDWIYRRLRSEFESGMRVNAEEIVHEYRASQSGRLSEEKSTN